MAVAEVIGKSKEIILDFGILLLPVFNIDITGNKILGCGWIKYCIFKLKRYLKQLFLFQNEA